MVEHSTDRDATECAGRARGSVDAVAVIGTLVASAGVAHAMYAALAPDTGRVAGVRVG